MVFAGILYVTAQKEEECKLDCSNKLDNRRVCGIKNGGESLQNFENRCVFEYYKCIDKKTQWTFMKQAPCNATEKDASNEDEQQQQNTTLKNYENM